MRKPVILEGKPLFKDKIAIVKPCYNRYIQQMLIKLSQVLESNMVTNVNIYVRELEDRIEEYLGVNNSVLLSACTLGMMLAIEALGLRGKEVLLPSFTFSATAHAAYWGGAKIKFVDCDLKSFNISTADLKKKISNNSAAILAVHIFGNPCEIDVLEVIAKKYNMKLIFDSAHAFGSTYKGKKIGNFGDVEIFSCSPTKVFSTIEGGVLTTNNDELDKKIRIARNYGNLHDYTCSSPGLNARMSELNAAVGLSMIDDVDTFVKNRNQYAEWYREELNNVPGIKFQEISENSCSAYKDFGIIVDPVEFGLNRDQLAIALSEENIASKKYFYPPVHLLKAYENLSSGSLPNTEFVSQNILCLPIYNFMERDLIDKICLSIKQIHKYCFEIKKKLS